VEHDLLVLGWVAVGSHRSPTQLLRCLRCWGMWLPAAPPTTSCPGLGAGEHVAEGFCGCVECIASTEEAEAILRAYPGA